MPTIHRSFFMQCACFLGSKINEQEFAFDQAPQSFYDELKDDPFGNQLVAMMKVC